MTNINATEIRELCIPLPPIPEQERLVRAMDLARAERQRKSAAANAFLTGLDAFVLGILGLATPPRPRTTFAILLKDLCGVMNPDRYRGLQIEKHLPFSTTVRVACTLLEARCSPEKEAPEETWDWIRIDDLPNQPWQVENVRTAIGKDIAGTFFEVQENDILIARLGPTILNAKFVICPKIARRTVASAEFLVLRCNERYRPEAVLWLLRTGLYREIMYLRSRGATPSRFRLDGGDLMTIPFPQIDEGIQSAISIEARRCQHESRRLRAEAEAGWLAAKRWFEEQLLGPGER